MRDVNILDEIFPEAGAFYVMDRGYVDFERLSRFTLSSAFFVVRTKSNVLIQRRYSHPVDKPLVSAPITPSFSRLSIRQRRTRMRCGAYAIWMWKPESVKFLTNNFRPARTYYRQNLQVADSGRSRSRFRTDGDHDSGLMAIGF